MTVSFCDRSRRIWKTYSAVTAQPQGGLSRRARVISIVMYLIALSMGIFFCITIFTYNAKFTDVRFVSEAVKFRVPDVIICPRTNWAIETLKWGKGFMMPERHQTYQFTVWYNYRLIDHINMTKRVVDQFTAFVREHHDSLDDIVPDQFQMYASRVLNLLTDSNKDTTNIVDLYNERMHQMSTASSPNLTTPTAESLIRDKYIFMSSLKQIWLDSCSTKISTQLLWWAIISPRYLSAFPPAIAEDPNYAHRMKCVNRPPNCTFNAAPVWVSDSHFCWMWDNRDERTQSRATKIFFHVSGLDANSDYKAMVIDTAFEQVHMDNFMTPRLMPDGFSERDGQTALLMFMTPYNISGQPKQTVCQPLLNTSQSYNTCDPTLRDNYWRIAVFESSGLSRQAVKLQLLGGIRESLSTQSTYSQIQIFEQIGGILGLFVGMSIFNFLNLLLTLCRRCCLKLSKKIYAIMVLVIFICFMILACFLLVNDIRVYNDKAIKNTVLFEFPSTVDLPKFQLCLGRGNLHLINVSKLVQYKVSLPLLNYLSISGGYGPYTGILEELELNDQTFAMNPDYWKQIYALVDKSTLGMRHQLHKDYVKLATAMNYGTTEPAFGLLRQFFLEPCSVIKWCIINTVNDQNCCKNAKYTRNAKYSNAKHCLTLNAPVGQKLISPFHVGVDMHVIAEQTDYKQHYWGVDSFLTSLAQQGLKTRMIDQDTLLLRFTYTAYSNPISGTGVMIFGQLDEANYVNGKGIVISGDVTRTTLLEDIGDDVSQCSTDTLCADYLDHNLLMQQLYTKNKCNCVLKYDDSNRTVLPIITVPWCTPEQAVNCLTKKELYVGYCNEKISIVPIDNRTQNLGKHIENQFNPMFVNFDTKKCDYEDVMIDGAGSPLKGSVERAEYEANLARCVRPTCQAYTYKAIAQKLISSHEHGSDVFLVSFKVEAPIFGTEQVNSYNRMELASLVFNIFGLLFGLSIFGFIDLLVTWCGRCCTKGEEKVSRSVIDVVDALWSKSLGWVSSSYSTASTGQIEDSQGIDLNTQRGNGAHLEDVQFFEQDDIKLSSGVDAFYLMCLVMLTFAGSILVILLINNANVNGVEVSYTVDEGTYEAPAIVICSRDEIKPVALQESLKGSTCYVNGVLFSCESAFSQYFLSLNQMACLVMPNDDRQILKARGPGPIDVSVYINNTLRPHQFNIFWVGDLRTLPQKLSSLTLDNWLMHEHVDVVYRVTKIEQHTHCVDSEQRMFSCQWCSATDILTLRNEPIQCCLVDTPDPVLSMAPVGQGRDMMPCNYTMYLEMSVYNTPISTDSGGGGQKVTVRVMDYLVRNLKRRPRHTWASIISMVGGYIDPFLGVSVLNAGFTMLILMAKVKLTYNADSHTTQTHMQRRFTYNTGGLTYNAYSHTSQTQIHIQRRFTYKQDLDQD